jgi:hypothetical protein
MNMEEQEKLIMRARLIASGAIRFWQYEKPVAVRQWCEILAEELVKIKDPAVVLNIKESVLRYGLHLPKVPAPSFREDLNEAETRVASDPVKDDRDRDVLQPPCRVYLRRTNNQVSEYTEAHIRELLSRGLSKSAIARAIRVNRRVVIRVARENQSAQQGTKCCPNDLGTISGGR